MPSEEIPDGENPDWRWQRERDCNGGLSAPSEEIPDGENPDLAQRDCNGGLRVPSEEIPDGENPDWLAARNVIVIVVYAYPATKRFLMVRIVIGGGSENVTAMVVYAHLANHQNQHIFRTAVGLAATEKRDGRRPARASGQGPTKPAGIASDHTATERQKCGRDAKRGAEERRRKQDAPIKGDTEAAQKRREGLKKWCRQHNKGSTGKGLPLNCCG